jgi:tRNA1(Val) A37 N6-methylase TrmN6
MVLVQAQKASGAPDALLPGLTLHNETGITPEAEAVLRGGAALTL